MAIAGLDWPAYTWLHWALVRSIASCTAMAPIERKSCRHRPHRVGKARKRRAEKAEAKRASEWANRASCSHEWALRALAPQLLVPGPCSSNRQQADEHPFSACPKPTRS